MLVILLIINSVLLFITLILWLRSQRKLKSTVKTSSRLIAKLHYDLNESKLDYAELEKGMDEQQTSYEQEFLTFDENRKALELTRQECDVLVDELRVHRELCLPMYAKIGAELG